MLTRRSFFVMTIMMLVLLFLVQSTKVIQQSRLSDNSNSKLNKEVTTKEAAWTQGDAEPYDQAGISRNVVLYVGDITSNQGKVVRQWCTYSKRYLLTYKKVSDIPEKWITKAQVLLLDGGQLDYNQDMSSLEQFSRSGLTTVFCSLPDIDTMLTYKRLRDYLGISEVADSNKALTGTVLYSGFLVGGEVQYAYKEADENDFEMFPRSIPWYHTGKGSKAYMVGLVEDKKVTNENLPVLIWRSRNEASFVFAVNGDFLEDYAGLGILESMIAESDSFDIYPVVNAQNMIVANFPGLANENDETLMGIYSRNQKDLTKNMIAPDLSMLTRQTNWRTTQFVMPQADYDDGAEPQSELYEEYLKNNIEDRGEMAYSAATVGNITLKDKVERDRVFFWNLGNEYRFSAAYAKNAIGIKDVLKSQLLENLRTIVMPGSSDRSLFEYYTDTVTRQCTTANCMNASFADDFRTRSVLTALGYSNVMMDLYKAAYPEDENDTWEKIWDRVSSYAKTLGKPGTAFSHLTATESDVRIRDLLNLDYRASKSGNVIQMSAENYGENGWFILRLQEGTIKNAVGVDYTMIEKNMYLLRITAPNATIQLEGSGKDQLK